MSQVPSPDPQTSKKTPFYFQQIHLWKPTTESAEKIIESSVLPNSLKVATQRFVQSVRWRRTPAAALANTMLKYLDKQLDLGVPSETLLINWGEAVPLPVFRQLREPSLLEIHSLPIKVTDVIVRVVRQTKLWRSEQIDVARELISHFQDGVSAGLTSEQLVQDFGDVETTARLIRRAKLRNRPLLWRISRRTWQAIGVALALLIVWWLWLLIRFQYSKPTIVRDFIGEIDAVAKAIPESDRAWPMYAEALTTLTWNAQTNRKSFIPPRAADGSIAPEWAGLSQPIDVQRINGAIVQKWPVSVEGIGAPSTAQNVQREYELNVDEFYKGLKELSRSAHWPALVQYAQMNDEAIRLILKGAAKPAFGFIFRDPAHSTWLASTKAGDFDHILKSTQSVLLGVLLPHIQESRSLEPLLRIETERARIAGDRDRVTEILSAYLRIAAQIHRADGFAITKLLGLAFANRCWTAIRQILDEQPDFLTDSDLRTLAHGIAAYRDEVDLEIRLNSKAFVEDLLQRLYSDDGQQDGHLTADGWRLLNETSFFSQNARFQGDSGANYFRSSQFQLEGSLMSGIAASRAELKQVLNRYCERELQEENQPLWEANLERPSEAIEAIHEALSTTTGRVKYRPLLFLEPMLRIDWTGPGPSASGEIAKMNCDATVVALGLELYHRRHGSWPTTLNQLSPELLPNVPLDRFDGKSLKYRVIDGKPVVYSVGRNRIDDGGQWKSETKPGYESRDGDWRLWPIWTGDL